VFVRVFVQDSFMHMHSAFEHVAMLREKEKEKCLNLEQAITEIHK
jgi:hypothetical protein